MTLALGIDTGGTYTDAALVSLLDNAAGVRPGSTETAAASVLAKAKALTTHRDLSLGIREAVKQVFERNPARPEEVGLVALSTTLATNAIVEGQGASVCLILVGYDPELIRQYQFERELVTSDVVYLRGGHDVVGDQVEPLDEETARQAITTRLGRVEAFAVSSYFGVRNPAHELRLKSLIETLTDTAGMDGRGPSVTCGHELTSRLNSVRRATTAALNARLIPLLRELIATVGGTLEQMGIQAPLMVVKGDGSLVRAGWALQRPIETILSGPAASVVGAWYLAGRRDVWVVDVGGTSTDIAALRAGRPQLNPAGAQVGRWQTMVEAADVHTIGLGGDSEVRLVEGTAGRIAIGPRRVIPLSLLASEFPSVVRHLEGQLVSRRGPDQAAQFVVRNRRPGRALAEDEQALLNLLEEGPQPLSLVADRLRYTLLIRRLVERLEGERLVLRAGFTPTDALHVLGRFQRWDTRAARLGAELLAAAADRPIEAFCDQVVSGVSDRVSTELVTKVLSDEGVQPDWANEPTGFALLERGLQTADRPTPSGSGLRCQLTVDRPVVAIGAPAEAFFPRVARQLHTELVIPPHAEVANAIGAVVGGIVQRRQVIIYPHEDETGFRVYLGDGVYDAPSLAEGIAYAQRVVPVQLEALARQAGADQVEIQVVRQDKTAPVRGGWGQEIYLETELLFTAVGRPSMARTEGLPTAGEPCSPLGQASGAARE